MPVMVVRIIDTGRKAGIRYAGAGVRSDREDARDCLFGWKDSTRGKERGDRKSEGEAAGAQRCQEDRGGKNHRTVSGRNCCAGCGF